MPKLKRSGEIHDTLTGYDFRTDDPLTRTKAIRAKCLECTSSRPGEWSAVRACEIHDCPLWPWRLGRRPREAVSARPSAQKAQSTGQTGATSG